MELYGYNQLRAIYGDGDKQVKAIKAFLESIGDCSTNRELEALQEVGMNEVFSNNGIHCVGQLRARTWTDEGNKLKTLIINVGNHCVNFYDLTPANIQTIISALTEKD